MKRIFYKTKISLFRHQALVAWNNVLSNEHKSTDQLLWEQENARRAIVKYAVNNIQFYHERYGAVGFELGDMERDGWFEKLPVVNKQDIRMRFHDFVNPKLKFRVEISTTGGSTGTPTKTGYDAWLPEEVYSWRLQRWFGVNPWDDHAYVWRDTRFSSFAKLKNALLWWPTKHLKMNAAFITEEGILDFINKFNRLRPTLLQGYVGAIAQIAQFVLDNRMTVHSPKFVWTTSAPLPDSHRKIIGKAFNAPVCDQYGSCEIRWIAQQCPECNGLHVNMEHVHIEFVNDNNKPLPIGKYGRTLLTNLEDKVFPLIRYENGDRGRWLERQCPCGRTLPIIDSVKGRESESFILPSGKIVNGEFLTTIFDSAPEIVDGFKVIQHRDRSITVEFVPGDVDIAKVEEIVANFAKKINNEVVVRCKAVSSISHDGGKLRFVVRDFQ